MWKQSDVAQKPADTSLIEKVAEIVGIKDTTSPYFLNAINSLLVAREVEQIKEKQMNRFNELLTKGDLNDSEIEELQVLKQMIKIGLL